MNKIPTLLLLLSLLLLQACGDPKHVTDALHRAEACMNEHPDSALALLKSVSPDEMGQNSTRALYALLYTQAQDKNYIDETNDSLIRIAVDYYRDTDDVRHKFLSYYYKGRVHFNAKDYLNATSCYMEAEQLADAVGDNYLVGLLYAELGRIYRLYYDYPKSLEAYQKAAECYERAGKIQHRNYMWLNQSDVCRNMGQYEDSERFLRIALESAKKEDDMFLVESCLGSLVIQFVEQGQMATAKKFYSELMVLAGENGGTAYFMGQLSKMYLSEKDYFRARQSIEKGWKRAKSRIDSVGLYFSSAELLKSLGEEKAAYDELIKGVSLQNDEAHQALQQPVLTAQRDYLSDRLSFEAYQVRIEKRLKILYILVSLLILIIVTYVFSRIFKRYQKESQQVINHLESAKQMVEEEKSKIVSAFHQLDKDKKNADETIKNLKDEIVQKEEKSYAKILDLKNKLEQEKQSVEHLKQTLEEGKEKSDGEISALLEKMEQERVMAHQTIQTLDEVIAQKEESRKKMEALILKLESDSVSHEEALGRLRAELEALQCSNDKLTCQIAGLLKEYLEQIVGVVCLREAKSVNEEKKLKRINEGISLLKKGYFAGEGEFKKVENMVNLYLDNVMLHFRKEVDLPKESDYRRVCYMFAGLSGQVIGQIMNESKDVVYQRRKRLLQKIAPLSCVHKEMFVMLLCK